VNKEFLPETDAMLEKYKHLERVMQRRMSRCTDIVVNKIYKKYGARFFRRCSAPADFADKVFPKFLKGSKSVLEIGTLNGITAAVMAQYVDKVYTIDIIDYKEKYELWKWLGIEKKIEFFHIKNELQKFDLIESVDFDACYMDGDHAHHTWSDFFMVRKCGKVLLHEAIDEPSETYHLAQALPPNEIIYYDFAVRGHPDKRSCLVGWSKL